MLAWCGGGSSDDDVATDGSGNWSGGSWEKDFEVFEMLISHIVNF